MRGRLCCLDVIIVVQTVMSWVCVTISSRAFAPNDVVVVVAPQSQPEQSSESLQVTLGTKEGCKSMTRGVNEEASASLSSPKNNDRGGGAGGGGESKIGSSPPSCENKCFGCIPCQAIQEPTIATRHFHIGVQIQYANYEPEGWKCKCGTSFFTP